MLRDVTSLRATRLSRGRTRVAVGILAATALASAALTGCSDKADEIPHPVDGRVSASNDGTDFEPCTGLNAAAVSDLGFDGRTWTDVSMSGGGPRGCRATNAKETVTLLVLDAAPQVLYPRSVAEWVGNDPGSSIDKYRFRNTPACAAVTYADDSVVVAAVSNDDPEAAEPKDPRCGKAVTVVREVIGQLHTPAVKPEFDVTADDTIDLAYTHALQVGRLPRQTRVDVADIVDGAGRLRPYVDIVATSDDGEKQLALIEKSLTDC